jgi:hypothetical protein
MRVLACLVFALPLSGALAVPVPEERPESAKPRPPLDLTGTTWEGPDGPLGVVRFMFEPNGVLSYANKNGQIHRIATWQQQANVLTFEINKGFRQFRGTINGDTIAGDSWNRNGMKWTTSMQRQPGAK